ncbi:MAG TPA: glycosyltransferase [Candidatus Saccharimonadales bacterium]|jgi:glycosyltransferase involved in cell wall biosynthesis|nr:glycosyltransferase [Candidatus Saccharimonadales bacterium]
MKIGIVVPHIFMHRGILPHVIFSPAKLALELAEGLKKMGQDVTLLSPGPVDTTVANITADLSLFEQELAGRGDTYIDLLKKHPMTFVSLARQVQAELIAKAFAMANAGALDIVHIYTNEEDIALPFAKLCAKPVVFTHHDPFNFLVKYKSVFPKYAGLNWISISMAQRAGMPADTNWIGSVYHGLDPQTFQPNYQPHGKYLAYIGRIIEPKGVHLAIAAVKKYNQTASEPYVLRIAGKHYSGAKDTYWQEHIAPQIDGRTILYEGFVSTVNAKQALLGNAAALLVPSLFEEPFGMVAIEALACGTPIIGLQSGALPEVIADGQTGYIVPKDTADTAATVAGLAAALANIPRIDRHACRADFEARFTVGRMCSEYLEAYKNAR